MGHAKLLCKSFLSRTLIGLKLTDCFYKRIVVLIYCVLILHALLSRFNTASSFFNASSLPFYVSRSPFIACRSPFTAYVMHFDVFSLPFSASSLPFNTPRHTWTHLTCIFMHAHCLYASSAPFKGVVNCQNTWDNVVPRMQQWPLDIPRWHITPHPQLSAKIIMLYEFHTHRRIKSKLPSHINSIYLSDIYEGIIHHFSHVGFVLWHKRLCYHMGVWKQLTSSILTVRAFPANRAHSPNVGLMSANVADVGLTLKQHWANFSLE